MTDADGGHTRADRIATHADAWKRTLADLEAMADGLEGEGWDVLAVAADHTVPTPPDDGDGDGTGEGRWGLVHVAPGNRAEAFAATVGAGEFPSHRVFQRIVSGRAFMVTRLTDPGTGRTVLVAGSYRMGDAAGLVRTARRQGEMYTRVRMLDGTRLGAFRHDGYEQFFPDPDRYERYAPSKPEPGRSGGRNRHEGP